MWEMMARLLGFLGCKFLKDLHFEPWRGHLLYLSNTPFSGNCFLFLPLCIRGSCVPANDSWCPVILNLGHSWWEPSSAWETRVPCLLAGFINLREGIWILTAVFSNSEKEDRFLFGDANGTMEVSATIVHHISWHKEGTGLQRVTMNLI